MMTVLKRVPGLAQVVGLIIGSHFAWSWSAVEQYYEYH